MLKTWRISDYDHHNLALLSISEHRLFLSSSINDVVMKIYYSFAFYFPGPGTPETAYSWRPGERRAVLPSARQHVLRPQLPQSEPLEHTPDLREERRACSRPARLRAHRNSAHTNKPPQIGKIIFCI